MDHYDRFLYYHCTAILEQIGSSQDYRPPLSVFTIVVLTSGDKHKRDVTVIDFDPKDLEGKPLGKTPHKVVYLCPKYVGEKTPASYREWLMAIEDNLDEQVEESRYHRAEILKIFQYIEKDQISPDERAGMIEGYHQEELQQKVVEKARLEAAKRMLLEGMEVGLISKVIEFIGRRDFEVEIRAFIAQRI